MERRRSLKLLSVLGLCMAVIGLTVAYASMSEVLNVTGTAKFDAATWDISFKNLTADKTGMASYELPTITDTTLSNYSIVLSAPGDKVSFKFDVVNNGTIDAILGFLSKGNPICVGTGDSAVEDANIVCNNLVYSLKYSDGVDVNNYDLLNRGVARTMVLTLSYPSDVTELPTNEVTISGLDVSMIYNQN